MLALGSYPPITLLKARQLRDAVRQSLVESVDPAAHKKASAQATKIDGDDSPAPFGRVRLDRICAGWSNHPFKFQLLASEVADTLRTLSPPNHLADSFKVCRYVGM